MNTSEIVCDKQRCLGKKECSTYKNKIPKLALELSNRVTYTVPGQKLVLDNEVVLESVKYQCEFLLFNSGDHYRLGSVFLEDYYSVYDVDNFKIALGKVAELEKPQPSSSDSDKPAEAVVEVTDSDHQVIDETTGDGTHSTPDKKDDDSVPVADDTGASTDDNTKQPTDPSTVKPVPLP